MRRRALAAAIAAVALLAAPASAGAAFDFGSNLASPPSGTNGCATTRTSCTQWNWVLHPGNIAGTLGSPISGVVVGFTLRKDAISSWTPLHLRVVRESGGQWQGLASSFPDVTPSPTAGLETFPVRVPIAAGDRVGIEQDGYTGASWAASGGPVFGATMAFRLPKLPDDGSAVAASTTGLELLLRARVEADADGDGFGDETQDGCPTSAQAQGTCPQQQTTKKKKKKCKKKKKKKKRARAPRRPARRRKRRSARRSAARSAGSEPG